MKRKSVLRRSGESAIKAINELLTRHYMSASAEVDSQPKMQPEPGCRNARHCIGPHINTESE